MKDWGRVRLGAMRRSLVDCAIGTASSPSMGTTEEEAASAVPAWKEIARAFGEAPFLEEPELALPPGAATVSSPSPVVFFFLLAVPGVDDWDFAFAGADFFGLAVFFGLAAAFFIALFPDFGDAACSPSVGTFASAVACDCDSRLSGSACEDPIDH